MVSLREFIRTVYRKIIPNTYLTELGKDLKGCKSVLDLGCGWKSPISNFPKTFYAEAVDIYKPYIEQSRKLGIHDKYYNDDVLNSDKLFKPKSFDCVISLSVIEHLKKNDGLKLIKLMDRIAKKKIIIEVPNEELSQKHSKQIALHRSNLCQDHKSVWSVAEMKRLGFRVMGISGWKSLKGEMTKKTPQIKLRPWIFWKFVSDISALFLKNKPEQSFELYCTKDIS